VVKDSEAWIEAVRHRTPARAQDTVGCGVVWLLCRGGVWPISRQDRRHRAQTDHGERVFSLLAWVGQ